MTDDKRELDDLPELPELAELKDLPELPEIEDLPELPDEAALTPAPPRELFDGLDPLDQKVDAMGELPELPDELEEELEPLDDLEPLPGPAEAWTPVEKPAPAPKPAPAAEPARPAKPAPVPAPVAKPAPRPAPVAKPAEPLAPAPPPQPEPVAALVEEPVAAAAAKPALAPGEKPPLRVLDKALTHLMLASKIVVIGSLVPFMKPTNDTTLMDGLGISLGSKVLILLAAWLWLQQVRENWEPTLKGGLKALSNFKLQLKSKKEEDPKKSSRRVQKQAPTTLEHPFPTGLHILSILFMIAAVAVAWNDPRQGVVGPLALAEMGMLGWAAFTFVHIASYERWGTFNPLFPLMFLGMLFSGLASIAAGLGVEGAQKLACMGGGLVVALGGGLAAYTIVESMMHAKKQGDLKKAEALEARKAARKRK